MNFQPILNLEAFCDDLNRLPKTKKFMLQKDTITKCTLEICVEPLEDEQTAEQIVNDYNLLP